MSSDPMSPQQMDSYRNLMWEIKQRIEAIDTVLSSRLAPIRTKFAEEFCYLQLRMICEVIAIATLVAHGNLKPKPKLFETYKADWIISELGKLHSKFYPHPLADIISEGERRFYTVDRTEGYLTQAELEKLWSRHTGNILHRGSAKKVLQEKDYKLDLTNVRAWRDKIVNLLSTHTLVTPDEEWVFYVVMEDSQTRGVSSALLRRSHEGANPPDLSDSFPRPGR